MQQKSITSINAKNNAKKPLALSLALGVLLFVACEKKQESRFEPISNLNSEQIISNRPQQQVTTGLIIKLPSPPLLAVSAEERADLAQQIQKEQVELEAKLKNLSQEIQIVFRYRLIVNALYAVVPGPLVSQVQAMMPQSVSQSVKIQRPEPLAILEVGGAEDELQPGDSTSVSQIGATQLHAKGIRGQNTRVGIIDTGIDYTHKMLGGPGSAEVYKTVNPVAASELYPNKIVVGGMDFVGTNFNAASMLVQEQIPVPDQNPLDEAGHGTHVAGTVAGHGDGKFSYDGVAPEAQLFALKVFGKNGSTSDSAVIAALEWAADPNADLDLSDKLDVVNLSLGSSFGTPDILYNEAIKNLSAGGTVVVASAGNSGPTEYITGAPAVADAAISVAASVDNMKHNLQFPAFVFKIADEELTAEGSEAAISKPIKEFATMGGELVYLGLGKDITEDQKLAVTGKVALIDRGEITFAEKLMNAEKAGAKAVIVANNQPGAPIVMGGNGKVEIPAIMIRKEEGVRIKEALAAGVKVNINFKQQIKIEKPELADTLTDFSSRGPRSIDGLIKPEISAPGNLIISAAMGEGEKVVKLSGTSMAAPHMAGVMALLKQTHPNLTVPELKSLAMNSSKTMTDTAGETYPVSRQGAGRIQLDLSVDQMVVAEPAALSLGRVEVEKQKTILASLNLKNLSEKDQVLNLSLDHKYIKLIAPSVQLKAQASENVILQLQVTAPEDDRFLSEQDGFIKVSATESGNNQLLAKIPVLALVAKISTIEVSNVLVDSDSSSSAHGAKSEIRMKNRGVHQGAVELFNLIGRDARKGKNSVQSSHGSLECDLESLGYRITEVQGIKLVQFAMKLYRPMTTWNHCEFTILIDANNDGVADQELAATQRASIEGIGNGFASVLLDAGLVRGIRKNFESQLSAGNLEVGLSYAPAVQALLPMLTANHAALVIVQAPLSLIKTDSEGFIKLSAASISNESDPVEMDDFLGRSQKWIKISSLDADQGFSSIPTDLSLAAGEEKVVQMTKGQGKYPLVAYMPFNSSSRTLSKDRQTHRLLVKYAK